MKSIVVFVATVLALVGAAQVCGIARTPIQGTFSTSGVYAVVRTSCGPNQFNLSPTGNLNGSYSLTIASTDPDGSNAIDADLLEGSKSFAQLTIGARMFIFVLIDASGSQVPYLQSVANTVANGIKNGINNNGNTYKNVTIAAAYFDGTEKITMLKDWDTNVQEVLDAITKKFSGTETYKPADNATNLYGAYDQALRSLEKQMNNSVPGLQVYPNGMIILTGDGIDTASSWYGPANKKFYQPVWSDVTSRVAIQSGYRYGAFPTIVLNGVNNVYRKTISFATPYITFNSSDATNNVTTIFTSQASTYSNANQGYWLAKWCSPHRPVTFTINETEDIPNPNRRGVVFGIVPDLGVPFNTPAPPALDTIYFDASKFSKGCDINAYVNSAQSVSVVFALVVLAVAALF